MSGPMFLGDGGVWPFSKVLPGWGGGGGGMAISKYLLRGWGWVCQVHLL